MNIPLAHRPAWFWLAVLAALAMIVAVTDLAFAQTATPAFTGLTPAPNSRVDASTPVTIAANLTSDQPITSLTVYLDGTRIDVEGGGRSETQQAFFTSRMLAAGTHSVRAVAVDSGSDRGEVSWTFTAVAKATPTPAPTPTPAARVKPAFSNLTPASGATVRAGAETTIAANLTSDQPITSLTVYLDGTKIDVEGGGRSETQQSFFTGRILVAGQHRVRAVAVDSGGDTTDITWSFTAANATPSPTQSATTGTQSVQAPGTTTTVGQQSTSLSPTRAASQQSESAANTPQLSASSTPTATAAPSSTSPNSSSAPQAAVTPGAGSRTAAGSSDLPFAGEPVPLGLALIGLGILGVAAIALGWRLRSHG